MNNINKLKKRQDRASTLQARTKRSRLNQNARASIKARAIHPILVLTSHTGELHRTRLLERGADDVLCKPYSYPELRARLGALLRRADARRAPRVLRAGSLRLDVRSRRAWVGEVALEPLRGKEYQLPLALIAEPERVLTKVNFESTQGRGREARNSGARGGIGDSPFPSETLAA